MSFDTRSNSSAGSESSVAKMSMLGNPTWIEPGTWTVTGFTGHAKKYREGECISHGFFGKPTFVKSNVSPRSTPSSTAYNTPAQNPTEGEAPPSMNLVPPM